jgi:hypothetical protein
VFRCAQEGLTYPHCPQRRHHMSHGITILNHALNPLIAVAVLGATIVTDAVYVQFTAAVATRHRLRAANWSGLWYLLSAFAVIDYTANAVLCGVRRARLLARRFSVGQLAQAQAAGCCAAAAGVPMSKSIA